MAAGADDGLLSPVPEALDPLRAVAVSAVLLAWAAILVLLGFHGMKGGDPSRDHAPASWLGLLLQFAALGLIWAFRRPLSEPFALPRPGQLSLVAVIVLLSLGSGALAWWSAHALGRHWSLEARVRDDHELVTAGPYAFVRHPIYTAMGGLLLATTLALAPWWVVGPTMAAYTAGTFVRVSLEERLLAATFGERHAAYVRAVPAVIPWRGRALRRGT